MLVSPPYIYIRDIKVEQCKQIDQEVCLTGCAKVNNAYLNETLGFPNVVEY